MESPVQDVTADETFDLLRNPYPLFAQKRRESGVFKGSVMDRSKTPDSMLPEHLYAAVSFDAVNRVFRDGKVFNSHIYDSTVGLFIGPTILAMEGKKHWEHRNLVSAAFKSKSLLRWEPEIVRPVVNALIDEFIDAGEADLVKDFTFEFPTRVISKLLGLPEEDLPWFRKRAVELISYTVKYKRAFEASAALKDYFLQQIEQRRSKPTEDIIGDLVAAKIDGEKLSDEAIYSFLRLLLPAGLETTYRSSGNLLYLLLTHPDQFRAVQEDHELIAPAIEEGLRFETPLTTVQRYATEDTEVEGVALPAGAVIEVCIGSAAGHLQLGMPREHLMHDHRRHRVVDGAVVEQHLIQRILRAESLERRLAAPQRRDGQIAAVAQVEAHRNPRLREPRPHGIVEAIAQRPRLDEPGTGAGRLAPPANTNSTSSTAFSGSASEMIGAATIR